MKIIDIKTYPILSMAKQPCYYSQEWVDRKQSLLVEILTDEGISGWGESFCSTQPPQILKAVVEHAYKEKLIGRDPLDNEVIYEELYNMTRAYGQGGVTSIALSCIDMALWDIKGKALNLPIYKLLGGAYRTQVTPYASGPARLKGEVYPQKAIDDALSYVKNGYTSMKFKIGFGVKEDVDLIHKIREAVGPDIRIMVDANCGYDVAKARRILMDTERDDLYWFEEPISPEHRSGYAELKGLTKTYIAAGECSHSKHHYLDWMERRAVDVLQPDLGVIGGFTEAKKVQALAQCYMIQVIPHVWGTAIGLAAGLQFIANIQSMPLAFCPDEPMIELDQSPHPFWQELIGGSIKREGTIIKIPDGPGLGIEVDKKVIEKHLIK